MKKLVYLIVAAALLPSVHAATLYGLDEFTTRTVRGPAGALDAGAKFVTGDLPPTIMGLGFIDLNNTTPATGSDGDGLLQSHRITLWLDSDGSKIAEATVIAGSSELLIDGHRYVSIPPVTLLANTAYVVSASINGITDPWLDDDNTVTAHPEFVGINPSSSWEPRWGPEGTRPQNQWHTGAFYGLVNLLTPQDPDISRDTFVDFEDLQKLIDYWLTICSTDNCREADLNLSGRVELVDFAIIAEAWLQSTIPGLVNWLKLDESSGVTAYDTLGLNNGTLYRTEHDDWIASGDGYVLGLDGQSETDGLGEYLYLPRPIQDDFTVSFWLRTNQKAADGTQWWEGRGLVDAEGTGVQNDFSVVLLGNKVAFGVGGADTGDVTIQSTTSVNGGLWHQIAATRNSTTGDMKLYVDGTLESSTVGSTGTKDAQSRILVGSMNFRNDKYTRGYFDDIRFYDTELTSGEVAALTTKKFPAVTYKKGVGSGNVTKINALNATWIYNWNIARPAGLDSSIDYVPMRWDKWWPGLEQLANVGVVDYLLGYNEPDSANQANTTVAEAVAQWPDIQAAADTYNLRLGSPATTHYNDQWIQDFMAAVDAPGSGLRVDFMAVHWYYPPNADNFMNNMTWVHNQWGRDVWVTEFNVADWDGPNNYTQSQSYTFLSEVLYRMEQTDWLKRYAIFPWAYDQTDPEQEHRKASPIFELGTNTLTPLGQLYASWDGDVDGPNEETWYFLNHESSHERIRDNGTDIEMTTIFSMGDWVQWKLVDAGDGWYYLDNKGFAQRLGYDSGVGQLALFSNTETGDHLKWQPVHSEYGWYFIDHKSTNKRLHYRSDWATATLESRDYTNENMKWRFINP